MAGREPFDNYKRIFGVDASDISAAVVAPEEHAKALAVLARELDEDTRAARGAIEGEIVAGVTANPRIAANSTRDLAARGTYAVGVLNMQVAVVKHFDASVAYLNAQYASTLDAHFAQIMNTPTRRPSAYFLNSAGAQAESEAVALERWRPYYDRAVLLMEDGIDEVVHLFHAGPTYDNVRYLIREGLIPLAAAALYPDMKLTAADQRLAMRFLKLAGEIWSHLRAGTPGGWASLVYGLPWCTFPASYAGDPLTGPTGYYGGGYVLGPDGEMYPLVIPSVQVGDKGYLHSNDLDVESLGGADPGWSTVLQQSGIGMFGEGTPGLEKALLFFAAAGNSNIGPVQVGDEHRRNDLLPNIAFNEDGSAYLSGHPANMASGPGLPPGDPRDNPLDPKPFDDPPGYRSDAAGAVGGPLDLATGIARSAAVVSNLDNELTHAYKVELESNDDGRRRALLTLYDVYDDDDPNHHPHVRAYRGFVGPDDQLHVVPVTEYVQNPDQQTIGQSSWHD